MIRGLIDIQEEPTSRQVGTKKVLVNPDESGCSITQMAIMTLHAGEVDGLHVHPDMHAPQIAGVMDQMVDSFFTLEEQAKVNELFPTCEKISIDYAVMEKTKLAYVLPSEFGWSDLGTWGSLHTLTEHDEHDNAVIGDCVKLVEAEGNMIKMPNGKHVVIQGLKNCIVSEHNGTLLICQLSEEQRIKDWYE